MTRQGLAGDQGLTLLRNAGNLAPGDLAPGAGGGVACGTVLVGGQAIATELGMVVVAAVDGQEALGVPR